MTRRNALVFGAGGHSRVVLSLIHESTAYRSISVIDINVRTPNELSNETIMGAKVFGAEFKWLDLALDLTTDIFLAIGNNKLRREWWSKLTSHRVNLPNLISRNASIDHHACLGIGNVICHGAFIGPCAKLGNNNLVNTNAIVEHEARISSHCHLAPASLIAGRSIISDECFIGASSTVIDGLKIASNTILGAGAVAIKNIDVSGQTYAGIPAVIKEKK